MSSPGKFVCSMDGTQIWTEAAGNPDKPAVVFIPDLFLTALVFEKQFNDPRLLEGLYLVRYDPRGQGQSGQPLNAEDYRSEKYADDFKAVVDGYNLNRPFICGWGMAGVIITDVVNYHDKIPGVILAGGFPWISMHDEVIHPWLKQFLHSFLPNDPNSWRELVKELVKSLFADPDNVPQLTKYAWMGCASVQHPEARLFTATREQDVNVAQPVKREFPFLVLCGTEEKYVDNAKMERFMRSRFTNVEFHTLKNCGHASFFEKPKEFNEETLKWVKGITEASA